MSEQDWETVLGPVFIVVLFGTIIGLVVIGDVKEKLKMARKGLPGGYKMFKKASGKYVLIRNGELFEEANTKYVLFNKAWDQYNLENGDLEEVNL